MLEAVAALAQIAIYAGVVFGAGAVFARLTLQASPIVDARLARWARSGAVFSIVATFLAVGVLVLRLGTSDLGILSSVLASNVGAAGALRVIGAILLLVQPSSDEDGISRGMQASAAAVLLLSFAFSGHAGAEGIATGLVAAIHVGFAGWWIASLFALRILLARSDSAAISLVRRFSSIAVPMIGGLVLAGSILILALIELSPFTITPYVRNLAIKLVLAASVFGIAAYNRYALTGRVLSGSDDAARGLQRSIDVELAMISAVLIATAVMTTYSSPHE